MASISSNKTNQRRRLLFQDLNGERKEISLGKISMRQASTIQLHVEELLLSAPDWPFPTSGNYRLVVRYQQ